MKNKKKIITSESISVDISKTIFAKKKGKITRMKSKALQDFEKELPKIYKTKPILTKSKLGTTKPVKTVTSRKPKKGIYTISTTTQYPRDHVPFYPWPKSWWKRWIEKLWGWVR